MIKWKENGVVICDGTIIDGKIVGVKKSMNAPTFITEEEFLALTTELKDYLLYVEGVNTRSYDNSDDERASCSSSEYKFGHYYEIAPRENSQYLLRIDGKIRGVVFRVTYGQYDISYYPFLFDNGITNSFRMGYSASHSSEFTYVKRVSLVKRGEGNAPQTARNIDFRQNGTYPSI